MPDNGPLTTGQAAEYCHVSQATIVNWIKDGKLRAYTTPGGHRRILQSDLVSFLRDHGMPIHPGLTQGVGLRLLLLSQRPPVKDLARKVAHRRGLQICVMRSDYEASAEVMRSEPNTVIIDMETCSDPLGLCRWIRDTTEDVTMLLIGEDEADGPAIAAGADVYVEDDNLPLVEAQIVALLERAR